MQMCLFNDIILLFDIPIPNLIWNQNNIYLGRWIICEFFKHLNLLKHFIVLFMYSHQFICIPQLHQMMFFRRQSSFLFRIPFPPFGHSTIFPLPFGHPPAVNFLSTFPFTNQSHFLHSSNNNLSISPHNHQKTSIPHKMFRLSDEVQNALHSGGPIVALESALITHGLQNPHNFRWLKFMEIKIKSRNENG